MKTEINKPKIIGVLSDYSKNEKDEHSYSFQPLQLLRTQYINNIHSVCKDMNIAVVLIPIDETQTEKFSQLIDGLLIPGGLDIPASYYGQKKHKSSDLEDDYDKVSFEMKLIKNIMKDGKPILGICRGMQLLNITLGGDVIQDISNSIKTTIKHANVKNGVGYTDIAHNVKIIDKKSLIFNITNKQEFGVNSNHHQAIKKLGKNLVATAISPTDNIIEAMEMPSYPSFFLGLQWHPEFIFTQEDVKIIRSFCNSIVQNKVEK